MKKIALIIFLFISSYSFADAGYGYRFSVKVILQNTDTVSGYIYVYSWDKYESFGNLESFLNKNVPNQKLNIYPYIVETTNELITLDFAVSGSKFNINLEDIAKISEIDFLSFGGGTYRLKELSKTEFNLIKIGKPFSSTINIYDLAEFCHLLFLDWKQPINSEDANNLYKKLEQKKNELNNNLEGENGTLFYDYFNQLKKDSLNKGILLLMYCESC